MLKETITFVDFFGKEKTKDYHFNLTRSELTKMELSKEGGLSEYIKTITEAKNYKEIYDTFTMLLTKSYGQISSDGESFLKSPEITEAFAQSNAFEVLLEKLSSNEEAASAFINGIIPQNLKQ